MAFATTLKSNASRLSSALCYSPARYRFSSTISEEPISRYCAGGYHAVRIGDLLHHGKYKVVSKLGYGVYSTVWLAFNADSKRHVALKILTADTFGQGHDTFELDILRHIRNLKHGPTQPGSRHVLPLIDEFEHQGPHGKHVCLIFKAMGPDMSLYRRLFPQLMIPAPLIKDIARQLLLALSYLHDTCRVIHTDIKPQNILLETSSINEMFQYAPSEVFEPAGMVLNPPNDFYMESSQVTSAEEDITCPIDLSVRLADLGTASWFDHHLTERIQPQKLRAPEVILGAPWDHKADIWNLGLVIWEFAEGKLLFDGKWTASGAYTPAAHLAQMHAVLGNMSGRLLDRAKYRDQYFDANGQLLQPSPFPPRTLGAISTSYHGDDLDKEAFLSFIGAMVRLDPEDRPEARQLLALPWPAT